MKYIIGIIGGLVLFTATMVDTRGPDIDGICIIDGFEIQPVVNHDCDGEWTQ